MWFKRFLPLAKIQAQKIPSHIAIIMDGNGRWATKRGLPRLAGHKAGTRTTRLIVEEAARLGIKYLTLYTFSQENWRRPQNEVSGLMELFKDTLAAELNDLNKNNVKLRVIGDFKHIYPQTAKVFQEAIAKTAKNSGLNLIVALNYSSRADIVNAVKLLAGEITAGKLSEAEINEQNLKNKLATAGIPDPDLIIRTSGELRLSNFLLWEAAYSEIWVTPILWPDFRPRDLRQAISDYQLRQRRFGAV